MPAENDNKPTLSYPGGEHTMSIAKATEGNDGIELGSSLPTRVTRRSTRAS